MENHFRRTAERNGRMKHSSSEILTRLLIQKGIFNAPETPVEGFSWPLYISHLPPPSEGLHMAAIMETQGVLDGRYTTGIYCEHYGSQLFLRSQFYPRGFSKITEAALELGLIQNETITLDEASYIVINVSRISSVLPLGVEELGRCFLFSVNFLSTIKPI